MELNQIFQAVEETQFLKLLSSQSRLFFVGSSASLEYIKKFFSQLQIADDNYYYDLPNQSSSRFR